MKRGIILIVLCFAWLGSQANDNTRFLKGTPVETDISEVTVYRNSAQLTRTSTVTVEQGRNTILFTGLTRHLKPQTFQLSSEGDVLLLSLSHRYNYLEEHPQQEKLIRLKAKRDSLKNSIGLTEAEKEVLKLEKQVLLNNQSLKGDQQNLSAAALKQAMEYFQAKFTEIEKGNLEKSKRLKSLQKELDKVNKQISELTGNANRSTSEVVAVIDSDKRQSVELSLTYLVERAGWTPAYDVRVKDINEPLRLFYKAIIKQTTGVDWDDVNLTVSSAIPAQGGYLPDLRPWYIDFPEPKPSPQQPGQSALQDNAQMRERKMAELRSPAESEELAIPVQEIQNQTSFSYRINLPYSVPSGGNGLTVEVTRHDIPAEYRYFAIPKVRPQAYLTANITGWAEYNLLRGNANLFFENTFVGKSHINPAVISDTLTFSLGKDESVIVERNKRKEFEEKNFFGSKIRESFAWELSARNSKSIPINIVLEDQIPVSQHEDIEVELKKSSQARYDRNTGLLNWNLTVPPGKTTSVTFEYEIEYPKGKQVRM